MARLPTPWWSKFRRTSSPARRSSSATSTSRTTRAGGRSHSRGARGTRVSQGVPQGDGLASVFDNDRGGVARIRIATWRDVRRSERTMLSGMLAPNRMADRGTSQAAILAGRRGLIRSSVSVLAAAAGHALSFRPRDRPSHPRRNPRIIRISTDTSGLRAIGTPFAPGSLTESRYMYAYGYTCGWRDHWQETAFKSGQDFVTAARGHRDLLSLHESTATFAEHKATFQASHPGEGEFLDMLDRRRTFCPKRKPVVDRELRLCCPTFVQLCPGTCLDKMSRASRGALP
jgi:hypothetical protein